ncbi:MAG: hypothetical protein WD512_15580 [Candidatus Paceibacterota bacterium]
MNNRNTGLKILFGPSYSQWVYDPERLSFITPYFLSLQTAKYAYQIYSQLLYENKSQTQSQWTIALNRTIPTINEKVNLPTPSILLWDMFGGIGTDSIYLSRYFNVIVTEIDRTVHDLAVKNVRTFNKTNINLVNDNCMNMINKINPNIVYFDPPWGTAYKSRTKNFDFNEVYLDCPDNLPSDHPILTNIIQLNDQNNNQYSDQEVPKMEMNEPIIRRINCVDLLRFIHTNVTSYIIVKSPINSNTFERAFSNSVQYIHKCPNKNLKFIYLSK